MAFDNTLTYDGVLWPPNISPVATTTTYTTTNTSHVHLLFCTFSYADMENTPAGVDVWCQDCGMRWRFDGSKQDELDVWYHYDEKVTQLVEANAEVARLKEIIQEMEGLDK